MTIDSKKDPRKPSISAAATLIETPVNPREAQRTATLPALKGQIASTLKGTAPAATSPERDPAFQKMMATTVQGKSAEAEATADYNQWRQWELTRLLMNNILDISDEKSPLELLTAEVLQQKQELTERDIALSNTKDNSVTDMRVLRVIGQNGQSDRYLTGRSIEDYVRSGAHGQVEGTTVGALQHRLISRQLDYVNLQVNFSGQTALNPELVKRIQKDPQIAQYVALAQKEASMAGIDANMFANQLWQESRFNPNAQSGAGAKGISQMMGFQIGKYGLQTETDFFDPAKSIHAGAQMMAHLTHKFGDQRLALVAYNGGGKAIEFVEKSLGKADVTFHEWFDFMQNRRDNLGSANRGAWHVETLDYTKKIALSAPAPQPS